MPSWIGWPEIVVVAIIALVIFGPKRLPELGHAIGKAITGFRRGIKDTEQELRRGLAEDSAVSAPAKAEAAKPESATSEAPASGEKKG
jgi:sec-independent protein translocase protein TatA